LPDTLGLTISDRRVGFHPRLVLYRHQRRPSQEKKGCRLPLLCHIGRDTDGDARNISRGRPVTTRQLGKLLKAFSKFLVPLHPCLFSVTRITSSDQKSFGRKRIRHRPLHSSGKKIRENPAIWRGLRKAADESQKNGRGRGKKTPF